MITLAIALQHQHALHIAPGLAAVAAGVHCQCAADGTGNAGEELGLGASVVADEAGQLGRSDAGFGVEAAVRLRGAGCSARHG
jgi:hypothetical protein